MIFAIYIKGPKVCIQRVTGNDQEAFELLDEVAPGRGEAILRECVDKGKYKTLVPVDPMKPRNHCQEHIQISLALL